MRKKQQSIFRFRALLVLMVFGISLLPRQVLHDFISQHKHVRLTDHPGKTQLSAETFSCKADDVFIQQNFEVTNSYKLEDKAVIFETALTSYLATCNLPPVVITLLRGPPSQS